MNNTDLANAQKDNYKVDSDDEAETEDDCAEAHAAEVESTRTTFRTSLIDSEKALRTVPLSATADEALASAEAAFRTSGDTALQNQQGSLITLGLRPSKLEFGDEQKDARKAEIADFKVGRVTIIGAFRVAVESAKDTFKTAKRSATNDDAKKAAKSAFNTSVSRMRAGRKNQ